MNASNHPDGGGTGNAGVIQYQAPELGPKGEELVDGETRLGLMIQLGLIAFMVVAILAIVLINRLFF